jgi:hypothetical protein
VLAAPGERPQPAEDWAACGETFAPGAALADGAYLLTVRSTTGAGDCLTSRAGCRTRERFTVDTGGPGQPSVTLASPQGGTPPMTSADPSFAFALNPADPAGLDLGWL